VPHDTRKRVLIIGGGFGGIYAAVELDRLLKRDPTVEVTVVNRDNFFLFTPMLHEVAASDLDVTHIVNPVRKLLRKVGFFDGDVVDVDLAQREVVVSHGADDHTHRLGYDHLVVALGSITNFFGLPGLEERALTMKSLGDAIALRNRLIALLEEADTECCADIRRRLLTFVVAGGGFAGVETLAGINDFVRDALPYYPNLSADMIRMVLVHPGQVILPELSASLGRYAERKLAERGIEIRAATKVAAVTEDTVTLTDGTVLEARTLIWTAGTTPNPLLGTLPCGKERGRICVDAHLAVPGWPGVWALGDCALVPDGATGAFHPPTAQHAIRQGKCLARNLVAELRGRKKRPFAFRTIGQLASLGRRTGVAQILGVNFSGFLAWWLWRTIYLAKLPRFEKKLRVALDWTLDLLFSKDLVKLTTRGETIARRRQPSGAAPAEPVSLRA
jgi:NADH dehydrogenase